MDPEEQICPERRFGRNAAAGGRIAFDIRGFRPAVATSGYNRAEI